MVANCIIAPNYYYPPAVKSIEFGLVQLVNQYCYVDPNVLHNLLGYVSAEVIILGLYYLHYTCRSSNHFLVCVILATKYLDDYAMSLKAWEGILQINFNTLRHYEMSVLKDLRYCLHVKEDFDYFRQQISVLYPYF
eukprot:NODE_292_length_10587_cov_0.520881.p6 type:complete len:136 gc:universal NODE_292_length_10587_cov_0.520881:4510-4917(+)